MHPGVNATIRQEISDAVELMNRNKDYITAMQAKAVAVTFLRHGARLDRFISVYNKSLVSTIFPAPSAETVTRLDTPARATTVTFYVVTAICALIPIAFLVFNLLYGRRPFVRGTSPNVTNILCVGSVVALLYVPFR